MPPRSKRSKSSKPDRPAKPSKPGKSGSFKIMGGDLRGRTLQVPPGLSVRPMRSRVRESLFGMMGEHLHGALFLDVFAGSGAIGIEAVSRGAWNAVLVDYCANTIKNLNRNLQKLGIAGRASAQQMDIYGSKPICDEGFRIIFVDPPFEHYRDATVAGCPWELIQDLGKSTLLNENGLIGFEFPTKLKAVEPPEGFTLYKDRVFGETSVQIWQKK